MKVLCAEALGFCFGVEDAIEAAQETIARCGSAYSLGPIIHNKHVVDQLEQSGLKSVESLDKVDGNTVVIRAHGVPPETIAALKDKKLNVVNATCVLVLRAQEEVRRLHEEGYRVVVIGDRNHPEVKGIIGYASDVTVIAGCGELDRIPTYGRLGIVAQTTLAQDEFARVVGKIVARPFREIKVVNTLCIEVIHRQEAAVKLCKETDVVFVLGGLHSANTKELACLCREQNVRTYHLESWEAFKPEYVRGCQIAGVTAGASTPRWIIENFVAGLEALEPVAGPLEGGGAKDRQPRCSEPLG